MASRRRRHYWLPAIQLFYTTPHYDGYGAILVDLDRVDRTQLVEMIEDAWRRKAPAKLPKAGETKTS